MYILTWSSVSVGALMLVWLYGLLVATGATYALIRDTRITGAGAGMGPIIFLRVAAAVGLLNIFWWGGPAVVGWFSHVLITSLQLKVWIIPASQLFLIAPLLTRVIVPYSLAVVDFLISLAHVGLWAFTLFYANSFFSALFIIEVLATITFLMLLAGGSLGMGSAAAASLFTWRGAAPYYITTALVFLFWISLLASVVLFFVLFLFLLCFRVTDWLLFDLLVDTISWSIGGDLRVYVGWNLCIGALFIKLGIAPFFIWKPVLFRGITRMAVVCYIFLYYTLLLYYIFLLWTNYFALLFYSYTGALVCWVGVGLLYLIGALADARSVKVFMACSSILNASLLLLMMMNVGGGVVIW